MRFTYAGWTAIAMSLDDHSDLADGAEDLYAKVASGIPAKADLGAEIGRALTIAEWRFIRDCLYEDLGRWQPTMADLIDAELRNRGWVD